MLGETYERSYNHNYMILPAKKKEYTGFCERILQENEIPGLLFCQFRMMDGTLYFYYEISGKRALSQIFQKRKIGGEEMRQIFAALKKLQQETERYLLDFKKLILLPEYLYADFDIKQLYVVYYPDYEGDGSLEAIGNFLIEHVDYQEAEAVELAYSFQQRIMEENVNLELVVDELLREKETKKQDTFICEAERPVKVEEDLDADVSDSVVYEAKVFTQAKASLENGSKKKERWSLGELVWVQEIREFLQTISFFKKRGKKKSVENRKEKKKLRERREEKYIFETEVNYENDSEAPSFYSAVAGSEETQLFSSGEEKEIHSLIYQGRGAAPDLELVVFPYIIGKSEKGIDGRLQEPTISRIHSQLDFLNETYYITDLNSTNGTFLNGERLCPNVRTELAVGDRIQFAGEKYLFQ